MAFNSLSVLERAIALAVQAHAGQLDDDGSPYILHPLRVMSLLAKPATQEQRMAAVLHDTLEQTSLSAADLLAHGIPAEVVQAVQVLTRPAHESRLSATKRAAAHPIARAVKRADILDNMDLSRIPCPSADDALRMQEYQTALAYLDGQSAPCV
ncbi:bifunctional (p)ppGpp synthetase/guanosine-3',5'-bis(diphosphate) 3'-pyrophosphohydrolase [Lampropedia puyangensis]|uniref:Bifunctional (P)ppGpp synthetase/guanosine-3',5'-bis(Diphosphate) 3'-pyrophosphohydrolase n=1 Tax=Lampropedia puyangensis TaxID=1330072 RepID=A0A4S8ETR6_9BURK|nr:HD domain-containing protein [Lampropedia puyangensis]THT98257.1 bifunctional (p)ppGpp synthetase/guanosine-3',5'-bis(diphosphate) 3'-pyrophosphohydrolase [Lampropedia puyangensis]